MRSLTVDEARARAALLDVATYDVALDLTHAPDDDATTFSSRTVVRFHARGGETFLDLKATELVSASLDGVRLDAAAWHREEGRLALPRLDGDHEIVVDARMPYRHDGEGMHRTRDAGDGAVYLYQMSFMDAAPSVFACFDQPDLKARHTVRVTCPAHWTVVGNGHAEQVSPGHWALDETEPIATYATTLVAGPYHQVTTTHDGILLGLECRAALAGDLDKDAEELFTVTRQCFDAFHALFGVRYPFGPDYHQAFVPEFNAGAMENPGCVTFRDPLVFSSAVPYDERMFRAEVVAHEMAHQWFGNLVTPTWWDDLWLNESFAEYMGARVTAEHTAFSDLWEVDAFSRRGWGLESDLRPSTHPVAGNDAADAASALQNFDGISYAKGAALLKQLATRLGDDVFLAGVRHHFETHRFGNATMADLFGSWTAAGAVDLDRWTSAWLRTSGPDRLSLDRASGEVVRTAPRLAPSTPQPGDGDPGARDHLLHVAAWDGRRWRTGALGVTDRAPLPDDVLDHGDLDLSVAPVLIDPRSETWAVTDLDEPTLLALPDLFAGLGTDEHTMLRASLWNAVRTNLLEARIGLDDGLRLVAAGLPAETTDAGVLRINTLARGRLVAWHHDPLAAGGTVHRAAAARLATTTPGSTLQLAAFQATIASAPDAAELRAWLDDRDLPDGVRLDRELRWRLRMRLAILGETDRRELDAWLAQAPSAESTVDHAAALAALPTPEAKAAAWRRFLGVDPVPNYELEATGRAFWVRGQEDLTEDYVGRYFEELPGTAEHHTGWVLADNAAEFFPRYSFTEDTLRRAAALTQDPALEAPLRRRVVDCADELSRAVAVRALGRVGRGGSGDSGDTGHGARG